jgi:hypothetical protein
VDPLLSYAFRSGGSVRVTMLLPGADPGPGHAVVTLRRGRRSIDAAGTLSGTDRGVNVSFGVDQEDLGRRAWRLTITRPEDAAPVRVGARLLAHGGQPVALLTGPEPATKLPPPRPRPSPATRRRRVLGRVAASARRLRGRVGGRRS